MGQPTVPRSWRLVAFGDVGGVKSAFGIGAVGAVLSGSAAGGHHDAALAGR